MKKGSQDMTLDFGAFGEHEVTVLYNYFKGRPGCMYLSNGDPGYPPEPDELEIYAVMLYGCELPPAFWEPALEVMEDEIVNAQDND